MKKLYLFTLLFLALIIGTFSSVDAETEVRTEAQIKVNTDLKTVYEAQKARIEAQRQKIKGEVEARKAAAEARGDTLQASRESIRVELENKRAEEDSRREALRVAAELRRAQAQTLRVEFREDIARRKVGNVSRLILATIDHLERIIVRIESRIAKVKADGGLTVESESFVAAAKVNLSDARAVVSTFVAIDLSSEQAAENFERIRIAAAEAREHVRAAHQNLMLAIRSLGSVEASIEAGVSVQ